MLPARGTLAPPAGNANIASPAAGGYVGRMPKTQAELYAKIVDINREACHQRGLRSNYGYDAILDVDLIEVSLSLLGHFPPPIRILDVGCGMGYAMHQLGEGLVQAGVAPQDFECWGMGLNRYDNMSIAPSRFIKSGLNAYQPAGMTFHLIVSVFTFHYLWRKLEGLEKVHNDLLVDGGSAHLHFPGYLVRFGESPEALAQDEAGGNRLFARFLERCEERGDTGPMSFRLVPYYSEDDDCSLLAEFGNLHFRKRAEGPITFGQSVKAFALFTHGFNFERMNDGPLIYVASHYFPVVPPQPTPRPAVPGAPAPLPDPGEPLPPYRITSVSAVTPGRSFEMDVAVHALESDTVVILCPGAFEPLKGKVVDYVDMAEEIVRSGLGAVVRYSDPYHPAGDYPDLLMASVRGIIEFTLETAPNFCATATPRLRVMAYSSSAGAIAALAADFECVDALLLVAPSFDVPRDRILPGYCRFKGNVHVLIGDDDQVVLPQQAYWYWEKAVRARVRQYVEVPGCGHYFERQENQSILIRSPGWAFDPACSFDFPVSRRVPTEVV